MGTLLGRSLCASVSRVYICDRLPLYAIFSSPAVVDTAPIYSLHRSHTTSTLRVVLLSVVSVCVFVCLTVNMITPQPSLKFQGIIQWSNSKGGQVQKRINRGARVVI